MSENNEIFKIITNYFSGEISEMDRQTLNEWIQDAGNKKVFKEFAKANYIASAEPMARRTVDEKNPSIFTPSILKYAAVILVFIAVGTIWKFGFAKNTHPSSEFVSIAVNGDYKVFENTVSKAVILDKNKVQIANLENGTLKMLPNKSAENLAINVPKGKNLNVLLIDNSEILLNSDTQLSFQSDFIKNDSRKVSLKGEAFFHVSKNATHPFYVSTEHFTTKVLGTKFNISSYGDENRSFVNLVEGKIEVSGNKSPDKKILAPGEKIIFTPANKIVKVEEANPSIDMDWLHKEIAFDNNTTDEVLGKIERVYGLQIIRKNVTLENSHFSGTFKIENLDQITHSLEILLNCNIQKDGNKLILKSN